MPCLRRQPGVDVYAIAAMTEQAATIDTSISTRLMQGTANALLALVVLACALAVFWRAMHLPLFNFSRIHIVGDTVHSNESDLRARVLPQLRGNFFTMELEQARTAFEALPWVRHAVVRRVFPNQLVVQLQEYQEAAYWGSEEEGFRLLSNDGVIFEVNTDEALRSNLPELSGPDEFAPQVLATYRLLNPLFAPMHGRIARLSVDARGSWSLALDQETSVVLGTATPEELARRVQQFVQTISPVVARYNRGMNDVQYADLRYKSGYALRLKGLGTLNAATADNQPPTGRR